MSEDIFWKQYTKRFRTKSPLITTPVNPEVKMFICIPAFAEPDLTDTLQSLYECHDDSIIVEVILLFNSNSSMSVDEKILHNQSIEDCKEWFKSHQPPHLFWTPIILEEMPDAKGGVGWARKLAMDEAAYRGNEQSLIVCLDADCTVSSNYITEVYHQFKLQLKFNAASIYFEHRYDKLQTEDRDAIILYELHLRYLIQVQRWCGHPFAFHTVGSSMAVRRNAYLAQGGMNTKRAGEDFYFLQKFIETNGLFDISNVVVYPSARISNRVPFGTGKAMQQIRIDKQTWLTSNIESFREIKVLFSSLPALYQMCLSGVSNIPETRSDLSSGLKEYLKKINFENCVLEIAQHTNSFESFKKRFFRYFNAFSMIRYMHYMRDHYYPDMETSEAVIALLTELEIQIPNEQSPEQLLELMKEKDRK